MHLPATIWSVQVRSSAASYAWASVTGAKSLCIGSLCLVNVDSHLSNGANREGRILDLGIDCASASCPNSLALQAEIGRAFLSMILLYLMKGEFRARQPSQCACHQISKTL